VTRPRARLGVLSRLPRQDPNVKPKGKHQDVNAQVNVNPKVKGTRPSPSPMDSWGVIGWVGELRTPWNREQEPALCG